MLTLLIVNVPIGVVQQIVGIFSGGDFETLALTTGIFAGVTALMTVLWQPFYMAANVLFYMDLRVRQENYDLELRLQQLESSQTCSGFCSALLLNQEPHIASEPPR